MYMYFIQFCILPVLLSPYERSETDSPSLEFAHSPIFVHNPLYIIEYAKF